MHKKRLTLIAWGYRQTTHYVCELSWQRGNFLQTSTHPRRSIKEPPQCIGRSHLFISSSLPPLFIFLVVVRSSFCSARTLKRVENFQTQKTNTIFGGISERGKSSEAKASKTLCVNLFFSFPLIGFVTTHPFS